MKWSIFLSQILGFSTAVFGQQYSLDDYFRYIPRVEHRVDSVMELLDNRGKAAQLIMLAAGRLGQPDEHVAEVVKSGLCGGVLLLNGSKDDFSARVKQYNALSMKHGHLPLLYSADAEPSLINYKIIGTRRVRNASAHANRQEVANTARSIATDLKEIGIQLDFAPVIDISTQNAAIGNRSFGNDPDSVVAWSQVFVREMQAMGIAATIKHFPGHGRVVGDTHKQRVYIDGEMTEVPNYVPLIKDGVLAVMVGHIVVRNNERYDTHNFPSTVSPVIVNELLRKQMKFKGLVVTDAMGMAGVKEVPNRMIKAIRAGCDIVLMPKDEAQHVEEIANEMNKDTGFRQQVEQSVRRIIRLKVILGLI